MPTNRRHIAGMLLTTLLSLLMGITHTRASQDTSEAPREYQFAVYLFDRGEFSRAVTEFERYAFTAGTTEAEVTAGYAIAACYQRAHEWSRAKDAWVSLITRFPKDAIIDEATYRIGECAVAANDTPAARSALTQYLTTAEHASAFRDDAALLLIIIGIAQRNWEYLDAQLADFALCYPESDLIPTVTQLQNALSALMTVPRKSPRMAVFLSAVVPGLGQIYAGRERDGLTALLVNMTFIGLSANRLHHDDSTGTALFTTAAATFYAGNLYGASGAAIQYNRGQESRILETTFADIRAKIGSKLGHQDRLRPLPLMDSR